MADVRTQSIDAHPGCGRDQVRSREHVDRKAVVRCQQQATSADELAESSSRTSTDTSPGDACSTNEQVVPGGLVLRCVGRLSNGRGERHDAAVSEPGHGEQGRQGAVVPPASQLGTQR